ncbi:hypothetical protein [Amycolatopsis sp. NPDC049159]|uniref:hypothetical protein n=1 Tax=Amycolatopsis sp. NPDC049159 TaxID=3157210 RepID=UPI0033F0131A
MTEGKWLPGGRLPAKAALALAIVCMVCALGTGLLTVGGGLPGLQRGIQLAVTALWLVLAGCYWFRYARTRRRRG